MESSPEDKVGFDESAVRMRLIIENEMKNHRITSNRIVIGGFSQGGALALHTALRFPYKLAGCVALSSWLPFPYEYTDTIGTGIGTDTTTGNAATGTALSIASSQLPILQCHGTADTTVPYKWGHHSHLLLKELIPHSKFISITDMDHTTEVAELIEVSEFIKILLY